MPIMIRPRKSKAVKIAYKIMGIPDNMFDQETEKSKALKRQMLLKAASVMR